MKNSVLSDNIKSFRKDNDLSLSELARRAGVSKAYLHQLENGTSDKPSAIKLYAIAQELGVTIAELIGENAEEDKKREKAIPESLKEALKEYPEMKRYKDIYPNIKKRGKYPKKKEDWYALYTILKSSLED